MYPSSIDLRINLSINPIVHNCRVARNCVGRVKGQLKVLVADEIDLMVRGEICMKRRSSLGSSDAVQLG